MKTKDEEESNVPRSLELQQKTEKDKNII